MNDRTSWSVPAAVLGLALTVVSAPAAAAIFLAFTPDPTLEADGGSPSPEGCFMEPGLARGSLSGSSAGSACHSGPWGAASPTAFAGESETDGGQSTALFASPPLAQGLTLGGAARIAVYYSTTNQNNYAIAGQTPTQAYVEYAVEEVAASGAVTTLAAGQLFEIPGMDTYPGVERGEGSFGLPAHTLAAGSQLRVSLTSTAAPDGRLLFGGDYADSGITLAAAGGDGAGGGGTLPATLLLPLFGLAWLRRRIGHRSR